MEARCNTCGKVIEDGSDIVTMVEGRQGMNGKKLIATVHRPCFNTHYTSPASIMEYVRRVSADHTSVKKAKKA